MSQRTLMPSSSPLVAGLLAVALLVPPAFAAGGRTSNTTTSAPGWRPKTFQEYRQHCSGVAVAHGCRGSIWNVRLQLFRAADRVKSTFGRTERSFTDVNASPLARARTAGSGQQLDLVSRMRAGFQQKARFWQSFMHRLRNRHEAAAGQSYFANNGGFGVGIGEGHQPWIRRNESWTYARGRLAPASRTRTLPPRRGTLVPPNR